MNGMFAFFNERDAPDVDEQPTVQVRSWRVVEAVAGDRRLLVAMDHGPLRITSPLAGLSTASTELITQSGRRYELLAPPETRQPQWAQLAANAARSGLRDAVDVSEEVWQLITVSRN